MESRTSPLSEKVSKETPCLPEQVIMEEILPRLPARSLLKFRCVSKPWCSLIGSKRFIKAHLKYSIKSSWIAQQWIFSYYVDKEFKQPSLFDKLFTSRISNISDHGIDWFNAIIPIGCCNGLVCYLEHGKGFILWNPTTKKFNNLPHFYHQLQVKSGCVGKYGFGFDELSDDYKVLVMVNTNLKDSTSHCIGMVYSLRSNSWESIDYSNQVYPVSMEGIGTYASGKLHWKGYMDEIVSFDLNRHVFGVVEIPSYTKGPLQSVGAVRGCLSAHFGHLNGDLDVWVMKEYGVKKSWHKVVATPYYGHLGNPVPEYDDLDILKRVAITPNGQVLLICRSTMVVYNPKCDVQRQYPLGSNVRSLGIYVESLASVDSDAQ